MMMKALDAGAQDMQVLEDAFEITTDPNEFSGPIRLYRPEDKVLRELPLMYDYRENSRALGLADLCNALLGGRPFRANWTQTLG